MIKFIKNHIDTLEHEKGQSSLLFIFSFISSLLYSELLLFKLANMTLIITSYVCNAYMKPQFMILDYLTIISIACSYINTLIINIIILYGCLYEYTIYNQIYITIACAFGLSGLFSLYKTYYYDFTYFIVLLSGFIIAVPTYIFKTHYYYKELNVYQSFNNPHNYTSNDLTYLWHFTIMLILGISSLTATNDIQLYFINLSTELTIILVYLGFFSSIFYKLIKKISKF